MDREIFLNDGARACTLCNAGAEADEPIVHTGWCDGLQLALKRTRSYMRWCLVSMGVCFGLLVSVAMGFAHSNMSMSEAKHELTEHLAQSFPPTVYYDPESGNMKVLLPPQPHEGEDDNHVISQAEEIPDS